MTTRRSFLASVAGAVAALVVRRKVGEPDQKILFAHEWMWAIDSDHANLRSYAWTGGKKYVRRSRIPRAHYEKDRHLVERRAEEAFRHHLRTP